MKRRVAGLVTLLLAAASACQAGPRPTGASIPLASASAEVPPVLPGLQLTSEAPLDFLISASEEGLMLVANPSGTAANFAVALDPPGTPPPTGPSGGPGSPGSTPSGGGANHPNVPYGFGFGAERVPPTSRRLAATSGPLAATSGPLAVGETRSFWINNGDTTLAGDRQRTATLRHVTPNAYFFVDDADAQAVPDDKLIQLAAAFEDRIRPPLEATFGTETSPGIDGDPRLFLVLSSTLGTASERRGMMGYFWPRDVQPKGGEGPDLRQHSNEKEVLFLSTALFEQPEVTGYGTLAHEYQHLIMYCAKSRIDGKPRTEDTWLDEGFSMLAMDFAGFGLAGGDRFACDEIRDFQENPGAYSLTDWSRNPNGYSYGLSYMFARYLVDRFGLGLIREVQATPESGVTGLQSVFKRRRMNFSEVFVDFAQRMRPRAANETVDGIFSWFDPQGRYGDNQLPGTQATPLYVQDTAQLRPWGFNFYSVQGQEAAPRELRLSAPSAPLVVLDARRGMTR